jgi:hypothetical protein
MLGPQRLQHHMQQQAVTSRAVAVLEQLILYVCRAVRACLALDTTVD